MRRTAAALCLLACLTPLPARAVLDPELLAGLKARSIGPAAMSGRVAAVEGVAARPDLLYVGAAAGGVWKSINGGISWAPVFDDQKVASIGAIAVFQASPDIVWVGTGEGNPRNSVSAGGGVYVSRDGGKSWAFAGLGDSEHIARIVLHPTDPNIAYVAALGKLWGENAERGVFKTTDGGKSWKKVLYVDEKTGAADLVIDPKNPNKLIAALWEHRRWPWLFRSGGPGSGLYVTVDGGDTWAKRTADDGLPAGDLGRIGLAISRSNPEVVYALVEAKKSALLRSEDGGQTFKDTGAPERVANRPFYYADIRVDPQWPNRLYNLATRLTVSNDSGRTFERLGQSNEIHGDFHGLWINPKNPSFMVVSDDGGVAVSRDRGETWSFAANLPVGQFYHVAVDNERPYNVYGGLQDNGSWRGPGWVKEQGGVRNQHWIRVGGGDGFETLPDPEDAKIGYALSQGGELVRYNLATGESTTIRPPEVDAGKRLRFNWNTGLALDPFAPRTLYVGSQYLHKSTDRGDTWTVVSPDLTSDNPEWQKQAESGGLTPDVTAAENFTTIVAIAPSPIARGVIWVGTDDGRLHVTKDGGKIWTSVEKNVHGVPANTWIPHIRPSRFDPAAAFVVFDNHRRSDFKPYVEATGDYGATWKSLATGEIAGWALSIEQDPIDAHLLFLGTELGLFVSNDGGAHWLPFRHGVPTVPVADLLVHPRDGDLVIATHGRALYVIDDISPLRTVSDETMKQPLHLFPARSGELFRVWSAGGASRSGASDFHGDNRPQGILLAYSLNLPGLPHPTAAKERERKERERATADVSPSPATEEGGGAGAGRRRRRGADEPQVDIRITDASGRLVRKLKGPARLGLNRTAWDLSRDAFKAAPEAERGGPPRDSGPDVPPGTYTVAVKYGKEEAKTVVEVKADPQLQATPEQWAAREAAIRRCGELQDAVVTAILRVRDARDDVDFVLAKLGKARDNQDDGEPSEADKAFRKEGEELKKRLTEVEKRLFIAPETRGIVDDQTALARISFAVGSLDSSWSAPSPSHLAHLKRAEDAVAAVLPDVNQLFAKDVAAFEQKAAERGLEPLAPKAAIAVK